MSKLFFQKTDILQYKVHQLPELTTMELKNLLSMYEINASNMNRKDLIFNAAFLINEWNIQRDIQNNDIKKTFNNEKHPISNTQIEYQNRKYQ